MSLRSVEPIQEEVSVVNKLLAFLMGLFMGEGQDWT